MNYSKPKQIGNYNKSQMLSILREKGSASRVELSRLLGLSPTAITRNTVQLLGKGIIRECGAENSSMGRKPVLIELCGDFCYVLGADMVGGALKVALADLMGEIILRREEPILREQGVDAVVRQVTTALTRAIQESGVPPEKIWAVTIGAPGIFDPDAGKSRFTFFMDGWDDVDIRARVFDALGIETVIENDVNLDVIGEGWKGVGKEYEDILYVKLGQGLAARSVLDNKLVRGMHSIAGEIGYTLPGSGPGVPVNYENMLCNDAIADRYARLGGQNRIQTVSALCAAAEEGDRVAGEVLLYLLDHLAVVLLSSAAVNDPQVIILGGDACRFGQKEIDRLRQFIERFLPVSQNIVPSTLGTSACLYGAVKTGLERADERIANM